MSLTFTKNQSERYAKSLLGYSSPCLFFKFGILILYFANLTLQKEGEYKDFEMFNAKKTQEALPANFYGKYKGEAQFYEKVNRQWVQFACFRVEFEIASV